MLNLGLDFDLDWGSTFSLSGVECDLGEVFGYGSLRLTGALEPLVRREALGIVVAVVAVGSWQAMNEKHRVIKRGAEYRVLFTFCQLYITISRLRHRSDARSRVRPWDLDVQ